MNVTDNMFAQAVKAMNNAYAPYSHYTVGACVRTQQDTLYAGCNVENASYGLTCCAEMSAICQMISAGEKIILEVVIVAQGKQLCFPCGACLQRLEEFGDKNMLIHIADPKEIRQTVTLGELFPKPFSSRNLET